jgi:DNA-binding response OmpR family regulator
VSRILVVDDEPRISGFLEQGLRASGFTTTVAKDGAQAVALARDADFDLVLLDIGLPDKDGLQALSEIRARGQRLPVILLTARDEVLDRVRGLDCGADDYVPKPFSFQGLLARIRARLRGPGTARTPSLEAGPVGLDLLSRTATVDGRAVELTAQEFALAETFLRHPGHVLSRAQLLSMPGATTSTPAPTWSTCTSATCGASSAMTSSARSGASGTSCSPSRPPSSLISSPRSGPDAPRDPAPSHPGLTGVSCSPHLHWAAWSS